MGRLVIAVVIVLVAFGVAEVLRRRQPDAPTQGSIVPVPQQLDRIDFDHTDLVWLAVVFSSATCDACEEALIKARTLVGPDLGLQEVSWQSYPALHERYNIDTVPAIVIAGPDGAVEAAFLGNPPTTELWAAMEAARSRLAD
ncbi:hypothetical protein JYT71_01010 [Acidimicrobiaceae bacterium AH-315-P05]|nr:hypothetical protein [Acidimicrobiaceae bacterium AH-315-P05]